MRGKIFITLCIKYSLHLIKFAKPHSFLTFAIISHVFRCSIPRQVPGIKPAEAPYIYLESMFLRSGLGLEVGVISSLDGNAVRSSKGLGVLVQFCQGFWEEGPVACGSLSGPGRWLLWKGSVCVSSSRGTPTIRSCLRRGRRPCVDWLRGLEPSGGFP